jgi:hypothetical protein
MQLFFETNFTITFCELFFVKIVSSDSLETTKRANITS